MFNIGDRVELIERYGARLVGDTGIITYVRPERGLVTVIMDEKDSQKDHDKICCFESRVKLYEQFQYWR